MFEVVLLSSKVKMGHIGARMWLKSYIFLRHCQLKNVGGCFWTYRWSIDKVNQLAKSSSKIYIQTKKKRYCTFSERMWRKNGSSRHREWVSEGGGRNRERERKSEREEIKIWNLKPFQFNFRFLWLGRQICWRTFSHVSHMSTAQSCFENVCWKSL